jgi:hypothetical protein
MLMVILTGRSVNITNLTDSYTYFFFATLKIVSMLVILYYVWKQLGKLVIRQLV